jgi:hypothetical protein
MAEQVAFTGFWAALGIGIATSSFEVGLVAALADVGLEQPIGIFFVGESVRAGTAGGKHSKTPGLASPQRCHADPPTENGLAEADLRDPSPSSAPLPGR